MVLNTLGRRKSSNRTLIYDQILIFVKRHSVIIANLLSHRRIRPFDCISKCPGMMNEEKCEAHTTLAISEKTKADLLMFDELDLRSQIPDVRYYFGDTRAS